MLNGRTSGLAQAGGRAGGRTDRQTDGKTDKQTTELKQYVSPFYGEDITTSFVKAQSKPFHFGVTSLYKNHRYQVIHMKN